MVHFFILFFVSVEIEQCRAIEIASGSSSIDRENGSNVKRKTFSLKGNIRLQFPSIKF